MNYQIGAVKADITAFKKGVGMMGYGMFRQFVEEVESSLFARAVVIAPSHGGKKIAWVNVEICFITLAIKAAVMKRVMSHGFSAESVMLTAQHTHGGPGGYSHHALYNMSVPGFVPEVFQTIVDGIVEAILEADRKSCPATIRVCGGEFPLDKEVAFNRSLAACLRNPEVNDAAANAAIDRRMLLFRFDALDGNPIATWNFFGVHATSISNDNHRITSDNKGHAAFLMEQGGGIAVFAQRKAGDVTPNHVFDREKGWMRGKFEDDFASSRDNGSLQFEQAVKLAKLAANTEALPVETDSMLAWVDFSQVVVDAEFSHGDVDARTGPACHGVAFAKGTAEGPGVPRFPAWMVTRLCRGLKIWELFSTRWMAGKDAAAIYLKYRVQGAKDILIEAGEPRVLGIRNFGRIPSPPRADGANRAFKQFFANGSLSGKPWIPQVLPLQLIIVGGHAFVGIPGEVTTIAGQRIENLLLGILSARGVTEVVATSYCNGYCGYITTFEEYELQAYEGGHTVFGKHTLGAFLTRFKQVALEMLKPENERTDISDGVPLEFTDEEISRRSFDASYRK